mmetsp:Transcript_1329/g.1775  ORF Transcript_1329/g.1775 Transcript_1329/m.1775 type:complete len:132 (-) Transcript_1329:25-420(-)
MASPLESAFWLVVVGVLWGCTNPLMKYGSKGITELPKKNNAILQFLSEFYFLFTRWQYLVPFLINMSGSVVFYKSLGDSELSLVVPITNSLTFLFTTLTSRMLGEQQLNKYSLVGIIFVLIGVSICVQSKV